MTAFVIKGTNRAIITDRSRTKLQVYRGVIRDKAIEAMGGEAPTTGPVDVTVGFHFPRPKSHYGTGKNAGHVKDSAPDHHITRPDIDKLLRALLDGMTGVVFKDDSQVAEIVARKYYGETPAVYVQVELSS